MQCSATIGYDSHQGYKKPPPLTFFVEDPIAAPQKTKVEKIKKQAATKSQSASSPEIPEKKRDFRIVEV